MVIVTAMVLMDAHVIEQKIKKNYGLRRNLLKNCSKEICTANIIESATQLPGVIEK